jgi:hypothetical protein
MARKDNQTYADRAKQIMNKYKRRLGDDFSGRDKFASEAMNKELDMLKSEQELDRAIMYKDMNKGMSMEEFALGGSLPQMWGGGLFGKKREPLTSNRWLVPDGTGGVYEKGAQVSNSPIAPVNYLKMADPLTYVTPEQSAVPQPQPVASTPAKTLKTSKTTKTVDPNKVYHPEVLGLTPMTRKEANLVSSTPAHLRSQDGSTAEISVNPNREGYRPYSTPVSPLGLAPSLLGYGLNARAIKQMGRLKSTPQYISPEHISLARSRSAMDARRRESANVLRGMTAGMGASQRYASAMAGLTEADRNYGEQVNNSYLTEDTTNAQYNNQAKTFNAEQAARSQELNNRLKMDMISAKLNNNQGLVSGLSGYMADVSRAKQMDSVMGAFSDNYDAVTPESYFKQPLYKRLYNSGLGIRPKEYVAKERRAI